MEKVKIALLMGSKSDLPKLESTIQTFREFEIALTVRVLSAHRTPEKVVEFSQNAEESGIKVILAAAGGAAHLAGTIAAHTDIPVIGIPVHGGAFHGLDALLSTVQMPGGVPVACVGVGDGGSKNAALFAIRIIALFSPEVKEKLQNFTLQQKEKTLRADKEVVQQIECE